MANEQNPLVALVRANGGTIPPLDARDSVTIPRSVYDDPGRLIRGIIDHTLAVSPYPNETLALAGAISLMSLLCGRRFRTESNLRSNLYIIGLGDSGIGKEAARQTNKTILGELKMWNHSADTFGSGEGLEDSVLTYARLLFQYDEIDTLFASMKNDRAGTKESIMQKILNLNGAAGGYLPRRKLSASKNRDAATVPEIVYHPSLSIYGTAVTTAFGRVVSERMQTNGLFARCLVFDAGTRGARQDCRWSAVPDSLIEELKVVAGYTEAAELWWANKPDWKDSGTVVSLCDDAATALRAECDEADRRYHLPGTCDGEKTMLARVGEKIEKLAMLHCISRDPSAPAYIITAEDVDWAKSIAWPTTQYALRLLAEYAAENDEEATRKKVVHAIRSAGGSVSRRDLLRRTHLSSSDLDTAIETLSEAELIEETIENVAAAHGKAKRIYRLRGWANVA